VVTTPGLSGARRPWIIPKRLERSPCAQICPRLFSYARPWRNGGLPKDANVLQPTRGLRIVNIASRAFVQGGILVPAYTASKHGIGRNHQGARQRMGEGKNQRQCRRTRLHRHRKHAGVARGTLAPAVHIGAHSGKPLGQAGGHSPAVAFFWLQAMRIISTARFSMLTAAGWRGDKRAQLVLKSG